MTELEQALATTSLQQQELLAQNLALEAELALTTRRLNQVIAEHGNGPV